MLTDWRWVWTEIGTVIMVLCVSESGYQMVRHSFERAILIHHALGFSKGFALVLIGMVCAAKAAASMALLTPVIYMTTGAIAPSAVLAATLWFEALLFGDMADSMAIIRCVSLTATALMLALFRFDRQARNAMAQLPTSGVLLGIEARVRKVCRCYERCLLLL